MYGSWGGREVDECCGRIVVGGDVLIDDVWVVGCNANVDDEVFGLMLARVRCDSMRFLIEV